MMNPAAPKGRLRHRRSSLKVQAAAELAESDGVKREAAELRASIERKKAGSTKLK